MIFARAAVYPSLRQRATAEHRHRHGCELSPNKRQTDKMEKRVRWRRGVLRNDS